MNNCINSSKVYCKLVFMDCDFDSKIVLIVAKCIVNLLNFAIIPSISRGINSSKVYCK